MGKKMDIMEAAYLAKLTKLREELLEECDSLQDRIDSIKIEEDDNEMTAYIKELDKARMSGILLANVGVLGTVNDKIEKNRIANEKINQ